MATPTKVMVTCLLSAAASNTLAQSPTTPPGASEFPGGWCVVHHDSNLSAYQRRLANYVGEGRWIISASTSRDLEGHNEYFLVVCSHRPPGNG